MRASIILIVLIGNLACVCTLHARPPHKEALADYLGPVLDKKLYDCRTCHQPVQHEEGEDPLEVDRPHNAFGIRLREARRELRKLGRKSGIAERLEFVANEDSDGDGIRNLIELVSGANPGESEVKPTPTDLVSVSERLLSLAKHLSAYPWRPFDPVKRPKVSIVGHDSDLVRTDNNGVLSHTSDKIGIMSPNPIDAFLATKHKEMGLNPRPPASKTILLRRIYLDLIGLPPLPGEVQAFLEDDSPDAYEGVIDQLLADPRYGERWGRHWMDVWRYSDWAGWTDGGQIRDSQPHIWRWRDWIVESLIQDKGYDQMILEMFAADELYPEDTDALRATGYLVRNYKMLSREKWMEDTVNHTFMAFQGVTMGCAKCHDHMFDPISQREYYRIRAIFDPHHVRLDHVPGQLDTMKDGLPRVYDKDLEIKTHLFIRGDDRFPDKSMALEPGTPKSLGGGILEPEPLNLPKSAFAPEHRQFVIDETFEAARREIVTARGAMERLRRKSAGALKELSKQTVDSIGGDDAQVIQEALAKAHAAAQQALRKQADARLALQIAEQNQIALVASIEAEQLEDTGRQDSEEWKTVATRAATAQRELAVLNAKQAMTAAEFARIRAKGNSVEAAEKKLAEAKAVVAKVEEEAAKPPTTAYTKRPATKYPQQSTGRRLAFARWLTDRNNPLTARVAVNHIWMRHFGQAIVPSVFDFGRSGRRPAHPALLDWLAAEFMEQNWSMKALHRLIVTSQAYKMASTPDESNMRIDPDNVYLWRMPPRRLEAESVRDSLLYVAGELDRTMGGPEIDHRQGLNIPRRSIYFRNAAEKQMEFLKIFDGPSVTECYERKESVMPQQALALANSELTLRLAKKLAGELDKTTGGDPARFIQACFQRVLARQPGREELLTCADYLQERTALYAGNANESTSGNDATLKARSSLVHVLMNHHEFVTVR